MASFQEHLNHADHNIQFLESFIFNRANDWALTVMFYTSVHLCEALIFNEFLLKTKRGEPCDFPQDCTDHKSRNLSIHKLFYYKDVPSEKFCQNFSHLQKGAHSARYKMFKIRNWEVYNTYNARFKPVILYFNEYCKNNGYSAAITLQEKKINLNELKIDKFD